MLNKLSWLVIIPLSLTGCGSKNGGDNSADSGSPKNAETPSYTFPSNEFDSFLEIVRQCRPTSQFLTSYKINLSAMFPKLVNLTVPEAEIAVDENTVGFRAANYKVSEGKYWTLSRSRMSGSKRLAGDRFVIGSNHRMEAFIGDGGYYLYHPIEYVPFSAYEELIVKSFSDAKNWSASYEMSEHIAAGRYDTEVNNRANISCISIDGNVKIEENNSN